MRTKKYDMVYSLGSMCRMADYLRMSGLRLYAGPFDWIHAGQSVKNILSWIERGFEGFIEKEDLVLDEPAITPKRTIWYRNGRTGFKFPHEFIYGREFNEMYEEVRAKYDRRIARFMAAMEKNSLLTYLVRQDPFNRQETIEAFKHFHQRFPTVKLMCFVGDSDQEVVREEPMEGFEIVHFHSDGIEEGDSRIVKGEEEVVVPILKECMVPGGNLSNKWMAFKRLMWKSKISRKGNRTYRFFGIPVWKERVEK